MRVKVTILGEVRDLRKSPKEIKDYLHKYGKKVGDKTYKVKKDPESTDFFLDINSWRHEWEPEYKNGRKSADCYIYDENYGEGIGTYLKEVKEYRTYFLYILA